MPVKIRVWVLEIICRGWSLMIQTLKRDSFHCYKHFGVFYCSVVDFCC